MWHNRYGLYGIWRTSSENDFKHEQYTLRINTSKNENEIRLSRMHCTHLQLLFKADLHGILFIIILLYFLTPGDTFSGSHVVPVLCVTCMCHHLQIITSTTFNAHTHLYNIIPGQYATELLLVFLTKGYISFLAIKDKTRRDNVKRHVPSYREDQTRRVYPSRKKTVYKCIQNDEFNIFLKNCAYVIKDAIFRSRGTNGYGIQV